MRESNMPFDNTDKVILALPVLGFLDVISTFYVESVGYPLETYEAGVFARFLVSVGGVAIYIYAAFYVLCFVGLAYALWDIKNRRLNVSVLFDKCLFLFLVSVACFIFVRLSVAFAENLLLPYFVSGAVSLIPTSVLLYSVITVCLAFYIWHDVVIWVREYGDKEE
jgi:hypothetical protein